MKSGNIANSRKSPSLDIEDMRAIQERSMDLSIKGNYSSCLGMEALKSLGRKQEEQYLNFPFNTFDESSSSHASKKRDKFVYKCSKVNQAMVTFRKLFAELLSELKADQIVHTQVTTKTLMDAAMLMQEKHQWVNNKKRIGHVKGIEVGERFMYRAELNVVGLHCQFDSGIDYIGKGENSLATSIVVTHRYANARESSDSLVYIGHGGNPKVRSGKELHDQKLKGGNLALMNSMNAKSPVRVILKISEKSGNNNGHNFSFIYDGLYLVKKMTQERGEFGKLVFKFILKRILGQPKDAVMENANSSPQCEEFMFRKRLKSKGCETKKDVIILNDISEGQEKFPIRVVTSTNGDQKPQSFNYIVNVMSLESVKKSMMFGCDCVDECMDCEKCACIAKNDGNMAYDRNKRLVSELKSPLIVECGPSCRCSSSCINRVSQYGIQFKLEIFKTDLKGWGVRARSFIHSGSFVCEYIGEVCGNGEARSRRNVDGCTYIIGVGKGFIDATKYGNIGRFINHSCSPNLFVKDVLYDHNDKNLPHKMLFAARDIPPGKELSYDYNSCMAKVVTIGDNCCHCRSSDCVGRIYL